MSPTLSIAKSQNYFFLNVRHIKVSALKSTVNLDCVIVSLANKTLLSVVKQLNLHKPKEKGSISCLNKTNSQLKDIRTILFLQKQSSAGNTSTVCIDFKLILFFRNKKDIFQYFTFDLAVFFVDSLDCEKSKKTQAIKYYCACID